MLVDNVEASSRLVKEFAAIKGTLVRTISAYHPEGAGMIERSHANLVSAIARLCDGKGEGSWPKYLSAALFSERIRRSCSTNESPFKLVYGVECRTSSSPLTWAEGTREDRLVCRGEEIEVLVPIRAMAARTQEDRRATWERASNARTPRVRKLEINSGELVLVYESL